MLSSFSASNSTISGAPILKIHSLHGSISISLFLRFCVARAKTFPKLLDALLIHLVICCNGCFGIVDIKILHLLSL